MVVVAAAVVVKTIDYIISETYSDIQDAANELDVIPKMLRDESFRTPTQESAISISSSHRSL